MIGENAATVDEIMNNNNKSVKIKDFNKNYDISVITTEKPSPKN
jgi:hypothetical protein